MFLPISGMRNAFRRTLRSNGKARHQSESGGRSQVSTTHGQRDNTRRKFKWATVFRGHEGYGETAEIHRHHLISKDQPIVVTIVDTAENLGRLIPEVEEMMDTGMIATSDVDYMRIEKTPATSA